MLEAERHASFIRIALDLHGGPAYLSATGQGTEDKKIATTL